MIPDDKIARVFATPAGADLMSEPWEALSRAEIEAAIVRMRATWDQRAPSGYSEGRRAWAAEIGVPIPARPGPGVIFALPDDA